MAPVVVAECGMTGKRAIVDRNSPRVSGLNHALDTGRASSPISLEDDEDMDGYLNEISGVRSYGRRNRTIGIETAPAKLRAFPQQQPLVKKRRKDDGTPSIAKRLFQEIEPSNGVQLVKKQNVQLAIDPVHKNITQWKLKIQGKVDSELLELEQKMVHEARDGSDLEQVMTALLEQISVLKVQLQEMSVLKTQFAAQSKSLEDLKGEKREVETEKLRMEFRNKNEIDALKATVTALKAQAAAEHTRMEEEIAKLKARAAAEHTRMEEEIAKLKARAAAERTRMEEEIAELTTANCERFEEVKVARVECTKMAEKIAKLTAANCEKFEEVKVARAERSQMAEKIVRLTAENFAKCDEVKAGRAALAQNSKTIESLMGSVSALSIEVEDLKVDRENRIIQQQETIDAVKASARKGREIMLELWAAHVKKIKLELAESFQKDFERLNDDLREDWSTRFNRVSQERERETKELESLREELSFHQSRTKELEDLQQSHRALLQDREKDMQELTHLHAIIREQVKDVIELRYLRQKHRAKCEDCKVVLKELQETQREDCRRFKEISANWETKLRIAEEKLLN